MFELSKKTKDQKEIAQVGTISANNDTTIVGLNSDSSIKQLKGSDRPINNEEDRKYLLENLRAVDCVEIFSQDTPYELIKAIGPDILVKGGDWQISEIVGSDIVLKKGGEVKSLSFKEGKSTTKLIEKIRKNT